ncbi:hypothetical protein PG984_007055 [Apiospora sp. TS-2023a]
MHYSISTILTLLAIGAQAIPTTNGMQAQPPRALIPRGVSHHYPRRNVTEPSTNPMQNEVYTMYNCGSQRVYLNTKETDGALRAIEDVASGAGAFPEDSHGCFTTTSGDVKAFFCGKGKFPNPPLNLRDIWWGVTERCGSYQSGLVGSNGPVYLSAGYISASQKVELDNDILAWRLN